jgi:hypothetical protein
MRKIYSKTGAAIRPYALSDETLLAMGRLVRAFAEIEDIVNLHMCRLANIPEGLSLLMLGRTPMSQKLNLANVFAKARGGQAKVATDQCFDTDQFRILQQCRNVVAHGVLLGMIEGEGEEFVAFRTTTPLAPDSQEVSFEVVSYRPQDFPKFAKVAEQSIPRIEALLRVRALREERLAQPLEGHSKAQPTRPPSAKHQRQRKPPREKSQP